MSPFQLEERQYLKWLERSADRREALGAIFNAANEKAVQAFLDNEITFINIYEVVERTFNHFSCSKLTTIEDVFDYDRQARIQAEKVIKSLN